MSKSALDALDVSGTVRKRAQYEVFEASVEDDGTVTVVNASYGDEKDEHTYSVTVDGGVPVECSCPSDEHHEKACKHRVFVALNDVLLTAVESRQNPREGCCADLPLPCFEHYAMDPS